MKKWTQSKQVLSVRVDGGGGEVLKLHLDVELQRLQMNKPNVSSQKLIDAIRRPSSNA